MLNIALPVSVFTLAVTSLDQHHLLFLPFQVATLNIYYTSNELVIDHSKKANYVEYKRSIVREQIIAETVRSEKV